MTFKKNIFYSFMAFIFLTGTHAVVAASQQEIDDYKKSWVANALKLQRQIDLDTPFNQAMFLGTHNSENSKSYNIPLVRYVDPNQILSIYEQLELGIRSLEFDVHWTLGKQFEKDILLCHALDNHLGCSVYDRPVIEGLKELQTWLAENPSEIVILYFDRVLDGHEPRLASYLDQYLGRFIYKPSLLRATDQKTCVSLSTQLTKKQILTAGKQLLIVTKHCDGSQPHYEEVDQFPFTWNDYVFAGIGDMPPDSYTLLDTMIDENFLPYPDCNQSTIFSKDPNHLSMWRVFEDRTKLSNAKEETKKILADDMKELLRCRINLPTIDMLTIDDARLPAAVWSWAPDYPIEGQGRCAVYQKNEGIKNRSCEEPASGFACKNAQQFKPLIAKAMWSEGESLCQTFGHDWHFAMPINGYEMVLLKQAMADTSLKTIALAYAMDAHNQWVVTIRNNKE